MRFGLPRSAVPWIVGATGIVKYALLKSFPLAYNFISEFTALFGEKYSDDAIARHNENSIICIGLLYVPAFILTLAIASCTREPLNREARLIERLIEEKKPNECENMLEAIAYPSEKIPRKHCCPISRSIMSDPVIAMDGYTYDREYITIWLMHNNRSPRENLPLGNKNLIPNKDKKNEIHDFIQKKQKQYYGIVKQVFFERSSKLESIDKSSEITGLVKSYLG
jgi:hypothetical protein